MMSKHLSYWIGFFSAALIIVPVAVGVWGATTDLIEYIAVFLFGAIVALVLILVLILVFRDAILRRILGRTEIAAGDVSGSLIKTVSAASSGDRKAAEQAAIDFGNKLAGWYAWTSLYRWVIASSLGLLLAFGAFTGTILLFEQNRKLGDQTETLRTQTSVLGTQTERIGEQTEFMRSQTELMLAQTEMLTEQTTLMRLQAEQTQKQIDIAEVQNDVLSLNLAAQFREQILDSIEVRTLGEILGEDGVPTASFLRHPEDLCSAEWNFEHQLSSIASDATIEAIADVARESRLSDKIVRAVRQLAKDSNGGVALSAVRILDELDLPTGIQTIAISNVSVPRLVLNSDFSLSFQSSLLGGYDCPACSRVAFYGSYVLRLENAERAYPIHTMVSDWDSTSNLRQALVILDFSASELQIPELLDELAKVGLNLRGKTLFGAAWGDAGGNIAFFPKEGSPLEPTTEPACGILEKFAQSNVFLEYQSGSD